MLDRSMDLVAFTHAPHGSDHHLIAFAKRTARGWHQSSWDVENVNLVGEGAAQMAAAGYTCGWGTGRHVLGSNYFHYVRDPRGSFCEYSADIDFVSAGKGLLAYRGRAYSRHVDATQHGVSRSASIGNAYRRLPDEAASRRRRSCRTSS